MKKFLAISVFLLSLGCAGSDTEMWFGRVADKEYDRSSCSHDYEVCDTCTRENSDGSSSSYDCNCSTHYEHSWDYYWGVSYDYNLDGHPDEKRTFESCGDCSLNARKSRLWDSFEVGQPAAVMHTYTNYLLMDENNSDFVRTDYEPTVAVPNYPSGYDFHRFDSAMSAGAPLDRRQWNKFLSESNVEMGSKYQVHMMVVATKDPNFEWSLALAEKWNLGKKNNVIFVFGVDESEKIIWSRLVSFSPVEMMRIRVRDDFPGMSINDSDTMELVKSTTSSNFHRQEMAEKEYLKYNSSSYIFMSYFFPIILVALIGALGFALYFGRIGGRRSSYSRNRW